MSHVRQQLRDALKSAINGLADLANHVYINRASPFQDDDLPVVLIMVGEEKIARLTQGYPARLQRLATVQIDVMAKLANGFDDTLENWATQIEVLLGGANPMPGLTIKDLVLQAVTKGKPNGEGQDDLVNLRLDYLAEMHTKENDPTTLI